MSRLKNLGIYFSSSNQNSKLSIVVNKATIQTVNKDYSRFFNFNNDYNISIKLDKETENIN